MTFDYICDIFYGIMEGVEMPALSRASRALTFAVPLCLAGAAWAQAGLHSLSQAEIQRRFENTRLASPSLQVFMPEGEYEEQQRMPRRGRYWADGSRLCTQLLDLETPAAPVCIEVLIDAAGGLYFGNGPNGRPIRIFPKPNGPRADG